MHHTSYPFRLSNRPGYFQASFLIWIPILLIAGCRNSGRESNITDNSTGQAEQHAEAIRTILAEDDKLGSIRNHACEDTTLSETVRQYVAGIDALDFSLCPQDFADAFRAHRDAWEATIPFFDQFGELRGEMHQLLEAIEQGEEAPGLQSYIQPVWDTWGKVDSIARKYGALQEE